MNFLLKSRSFTINREHTSAFYGTDGNTALEVFLDERIDQKHRNGGYNGAGHLDTGLVQVQSVTSCVTKTFHQLHVCRFGISYDVVTNDQLQRIPVLITHVQLCGEPAVPQTNGYEHSDGCQHRNGQRVDDAEQDRVLVCSVDSCCLLQSVR